MKKAIFQVQPQYADRDKWMALSEREGLFFESLEPVFHLEELDFSDPRLRWYRDCGKTHALHGAFIDVNPASGDASFRELSRRRCRESCRIAKFLGAEYVLFHASAFPFLRGNYLSGWADCCAEFYGQLAAEYGLHICVENSQDLDPAPLGELMRRSGRKDVSVCLDIGHVAYSRAPIAQWFDALGDAISYLHLSDNMGLFDDHLSIGAGKIDWFEVDYLSRQLNKAVPVTLEVGGIDGTEASLSYLRRHGLFGMGESAHD